MRDAAPWQWYRPHVGSVDSLVLFRNFLFTSGDRRVLGSDIYSGETLGQVTRDSGKIPCLVEKDGYIYSCSSNGNYVFLLPMPMYLLYSLIHIQAVNYDDE